MAHHYALGSFWEVYDKLPVHVRAAADKNFQLMRATPNHPSLKFKKVGPLYSARVGLHYRALARQRGDDYYWFWIGSHADYDRMIG